MNISYQNQANIYMSDYGLIDSLSYIHVSFKRGDPITCSILLFVEKQKGAEGK